MRTVRLGGPKVRKARRNAADAHEEERCSCIGILPLHPCWILGVDSRMDALDAMIRDGISLARSVELTAQWDEILRVGPVSPGESRRLVEDLHCRLSDFIHKVVVHRREEAIRGWRNWSREDPLVHPHKWLRSDLVLPAPFLQGQPHLTPGGS